MEETYDKPYETEAAEKQAASALQFGDINLVPNLMPQIPWLSPSKQSPVEEYKKQLAIHQREAVRLTELIKLLEENPTLLRVLHLMKG